jgi:hypothetical protein
MRKQETLIQCVFISWNLKNWGEGGGESRKPHAVQSSGVRQQSLFLYATSGRILLLSFFGLQLRQRVHRRKYLQWCRNERLPVRYFESTRCSVAQIATTRRAEGGLRAVHTRVVPNPTESGYISRFREILSAHKGGDRQRGSSSEFIADRQRHFPCPHLPYT